MKFRVLVVGFIAFSAGLAGTFPDTAGAQDYPTVNGGIRSHATTVTPPFNIRQTEGCIGFENGISSNVALQISDCAGNLSVSGTIGHQKWTWVGVSRNNVGEVDTFAFRNTISNTCISVQNKSTESGALLVHEACNYQDPSQLWMTTDTNSWSGQIGLMNVHSGKCAYPVGIMEKPAFLEQLDCVGTRWHYFQVILERV